MPVDLLHGLQETCLHGLAPARHGAVELLEARDQGGLQLLPRLPVAFVLLRAQVRCKLLHGFGVSLALQRHGNLLPCKGVQGLVLGGQGAKLTRHAPHLGLHDLGLQQGLPQAALGTTEALQELSGLRSILAHLVAQCLESLLLALLS